MRSPHLAELIDLEVQLRADAALPPEELRTRDSAIGQRIGAQALDDRSATLRWLVELRSPHGPGALAEQRRHQVSAALLVAGLTLGAVSVGGWLATGSREPVNVVYFWPFFVGSQIALAAGFWLAIVPRERLARLPLLAGFQALLSTLAGAVPRAVGALLARVSPSTHERWSDSLGEFAQLDWLYGRLRFWLLVQMTQLFAVAFNVGALAAFLLIPSIDDPAFGWRSRLLDERQVGFASAVIATPWSGLWPEALPGPETIEATRYTSVAERYASRDDDGAEDAAGERPWAAWWPFLVASVAFYGLAPRLLYIAIAAFGVRRARARVPFDRVEILRLCERLRRPSAQTTGVGDEDSEVWSERDAAPPLSDWPRPERALALRWVGIELRDEVLAQGLTERFGARPSAVYAIGDVDGEGDAAALSAIASAPRDEGVYLVVASWEPPVGDQMDLLDAIREGAGPTRPVLVVLHARGTDGSSAAPEPRHRAIWQKALQRRRDPALFVELLVPAASEEAV